MVVTNREDVEFQTLDGVTLRGWLYPAPSRGPAVIMSPGVSIATINALYNYRDRFIVQLRQGDAIARSGGRLSCSWVHHSGV